MTSSIAEYFINEIDNWKEALDFRMEEISELREWLEEVIRLDTVPGLAGKVEHRLNQLFISRQNATNLYVKMEAFQKKDI